MNHKPNILQIFSRYLQYGGEEDVVTRCGRSLGKRFHVDDFIRSSEDLIGRGFSDRIKLPARIFHNADVINELRELQQQNQYDAWLIHNVFPAISPSVYTLAETLGVPVIQYLHNYRFGCANGYLFTKGAECRKCIHGNFLHGAIGKCWRDSYAQSSAMALLLARTRHRQKVFETITHFIAISEAQKRIHVEMGIPEDRITVIHHFLQLPDGHVPLEYPKHGHALFIGRLSPEKGVDRLLDAWALIPRDKKLVIAGSGPMEDQLRAQASHLGLNNVSFTGFLDKDSQTSVWENTLFSVVPSVWQEPFGMVALEAWSKGRPIVAHDIGALPEIVDHGKNGFLADPRSPQSLADSIRLAFDRIEALPKMGEAGLRKLTSHFSEQKWLDEISPVFGNLFAATWKRNSPDKYSTTEARNQKVTAAFVTMNRCETAITCLQHLAAQTRRPEQILIINNASTDETKERIEAFSKAHQELNITFFNLRENLGNAGGMEVAFDKAFKDDADAVWILDDDSWPQPDALEKILAADVPEESLSSCRVIDQDSNKLSWPLQIQTGDSWGLIEEDHQLPKRPIIRIRRSWLGALVTRSIFETVGSVDGRLFLRGEDEDYPRRIENAGIHTYLVTDSVLHHPAAQKLHKLRLFGNEVILEDGLTGNKLYYRLRNSWWNTKRDKGVASMLAIAFLHGLLLLKNQRPLLLWTPVWWEALLDASKSRLGERKPI